VSGCDSELHCLTTLIINKFNIVSSARGRGDMQWDYYKPFEYHIQTLSRLNITFKLLPECEHHSIHNRPDVNPILPDISLPEIADDR